MQRKKLKRTFFCSLQTNVDKALDMTILLILGRFSAKVINSNEHCEIVMSREDVGEINSKGKKLQFL